MVRPVATRVHRDAYVTAYNDRGRTSRGFWTNSAYPFVAVPMDGRHGYREGDIFAIKGTNGVTQYAIAYDVGSMPNGAALDLYDGVLTRRLGMVLSGSSLSNSSGIQIQKIGHIPLSYGDERMTSIVQTLNDINAGRKPLSSLMENRWLTEVASNYSGYSIFAKGPDAPQLGRNLSAFLGEPGVGATRDTLKRAMARDGGIRSVLGDFNVDQARELSTAQVQALNSYLGGKVLTHTVDLTRRHQASLTGGPALSVAENRQLQLGLNALGFRGLNGRDELVVDGVVQRASGRITNTLHAMNAFRTAHADLFKGPVVAEPDRTTPEVVPRIVPVAPPALDRVRPTFELPPDFKLPPIQIKPLGGFEITSFESPTGADGLVPPTALHAGVVGQGMMQATLDWLTHNPAGAETSVTHVKYSPDGRTEGSLGDLPRYTTASAEQTQERHEERRQAAGGLEA